MRRSVTKFVPFTQAGPIRRIVGSLDFKGQGTNHPQLPSLDPFILCDDSQTIVGPGKPPFGMHPHYGLLAVSTILEGAWSDEDNLNGQSKEYNEAGGVYTVAAGEGVAHNEVTRSDGVNRLIQTIVKIPKDKLTLEPQTAKASAAQLPKVDLDGGQMVIVFGTNDGVTSPASLKAMARALIARVKVNAGAKVILPLDKDFEHGFVYPESDDCKAQIGGMNFSGPGAYVFGAGQELEIANSSAEKPLELFLAAGAPLNEPWVKLLGFNGFIVAEDEATAENVMAKVQEVGVQNFSFKSLK